LCTQHAGTGRRRFLPPSSDLHDTGPGACRFAAKFVMCSVAGVGGWPKLALQQ
jgi:hypothetical protein